MIPKNYSAKFTEFSKNKLFQSLDQPLQVFIQNTGESYGLTFQELNQLTEIAVDYHMWNEPSIEEKWNQIEPLFLSFCLLFPVPSKNTPTLIIQGHFLGGSFGLFLSLLTFNFLIFVSFWIPLIKCFHGRCVIPKSS